MVIKGASLLVAILLLTLSPLAGATPHQSYANFAQPLSTYQLSSRNVTFQSGTEARTLSVSVSDYAVYRKAYISMDGRSWQNVTLSGKALGGDWLNGSVTGQVSLTAANFSLTQSRLSTQRNFMVVYTCSRSGNAWDCHSGWQIWQFNATLAKAGPPSWQQGMLAWWKFDGNAADSVGGNDGTVRGVVFVASGISGQAAEFNDDMIEVQNSPDIAHNDAMTLAFWMKGQGGASGDDIFEKADWEHQGYRLLKSGDDIEFLLYTDMSSTYTTATPLDGDWHHVAVTLDRGQIRIYVDGVSSGTRSTYSHGSGIGTAGNLYMGGLGTDFVGLLDEVMLFNRSLSATEVAGMYAFFTGTACAGDAGCPADYQGAPYCSGGDAYRDYHDWSCSGGSCVESVAAVLVRDCVAGEACVSGACVACTPNANECGPDGCGGYHPDCGTGFACSSSGTCTEVSGIQQLKVSANGRFLVREDGTPFFYMGDTAWRITQRLNDADMDYYLDDRADKEFTVIQAVAVDGDDDSNPQHDLYGSYPFNGGVGNPNEAYWQRIDTLIDKAAERGLYVALTAAWGSSLVRCCDNGFINSGNAFDYGWFLGDRYKDRDNVIWILGGDHYIGNWDTPEPDFSSQAVSVYRLLAQGIAAGASGSQSFSPSQYSNVIMTYHTAGWYAIADPELSSSAFLHNEPWLDFNTFQSGHFDFRVNYGFAANDYAMAPAKPTLDFESLYEGHWYGWNPSAGTSTTADIRNYAYWSVFAGSAGHGYGHCIMFQYYDDSYDWTFECGPMEYWKNGNVINSPGATQMKYVRRLIESRAPMLDRIPDQGLVTSGQGTKESRVQTTMDKNGRYAMAYVTNRDNTPTVSVDMSKVAGTQARVWWYNPVDGSYQDGGTITNTKQSRSFSVPASSSHKDWVLVIDDASVGFGPPGG